MATGFLRYRADDPNMPASANTYEDARLTFWCTDCSLFDLTGNTDKTQLVVRLAVAVALGRRISPSLEDPRRPDAIEYTLTPADALHLARELIYFAGVATKRNEST